MSLFQLADILLIHAVWLGPRQFHTTEHVSYENLKGNHLSIDTLSHSDVLFIILLHRVYCEQPSPKASKLSVARLEAVIPSEREAAAADTLEKSS